MSWDGKRILVAGGAGFVGSNLVRALLGGRPARGDRRRQPAVLRARERPDDARVTFIEASINDADVLADLPEQIDWAFQLTTYHGNQSSIADPLADHEHNTLPTLSLLEALKDRPVEKIVYAGAGCTVAEKTFDGASATTEEAPVSLWLDSPVPDLEDRRRVLLQLLLHPARHARGQGALSERVRPGRGARSRALARNPAYRLAQRDAHVRLQGAQAGGAAGRERRHRHARPDLRATTWHAD